MLYMRFLPHLGLEERKETAVVLDVKDKKILWLLGKNTRIPLSQIAKKVQLSRDAIAYRIQRFRQRGIIHATRTIIDTSQFGYDSYHLFMKLKNPEKKTEEELITRLKDLPYVRAVLKFYGNFDFEIALIAKNVLEFDRILSEIVSKTEKFLEDYEILVITKAFRVGAFPGNFLKGFEERKDFFTMKRITYVPDQKDLEILKLIRDDAQLSLVAIGGKVKLSADTVNYRLKKLFEGGIILGYVPVINYTALGYRIYTLLLQISNLDKLKEKLLGEFLKQDENILWAVKTVGRYNVLSYVCVKEEHAFHETLNRLRTLFPEQIKNYQALPTYAEYKYTHAPDCIFG